MHSRKSGTQAAHLHKCQSSYCVDIFCGFLSVLQTIEGNYTTAAWLIFFAAVFDALDGRIARATGQSNEFGLQMDSLGDVISSGLAPAVLVYTVQLKSLHPPVGLILAFFPVLFAAFRLARFNVFTLSEGKKSDYLGLPAPMAGVTLASCVILYQSVQWDLLLPNAGRLARCKPVMASTIRTRACRASRSGKGFTASSSSSFSSSQRSFSLSRLCAPFPS